MDPTGAAAPEVKNCPLLQNAVYCKAGMHFKAVSS